jgi:rubredoxin
MKKLVDQESYFCDVCHRYVFSEKRGEPRCGIAPLTDFVDVPDNFRCPDCGAPKCEFLPVHQIGWLDGPLSATIDELSRTGKRP